MKQQIEQCAICGNNARLSVVKQWTISATPTKPAVTIDDVACWECTVCGERHLDPEQIRIFEGKVIEAHRKAKGLLSAEEIYLVRKQLDISKERLEKILNLNPKSFYRWENGLSIQSDAVDTMLRLLRKHPDAIYDLAEERGITVTGQRGRPKKAAG